MAVLAFVYKVLIKLTLDV